ncbi:MAG: hypothetical protein ABSA66_02800 [Roseiarcus sp.]|jgi:hypothetical protein
MRIRKLVAVLATASLAFWTPSIIPVKAVTNVILPCGVEAGQYQTIDTAYAGALIVPCPTSHAPSPWPVVAVFVGTFSVMLNAAIVWNTQCRELTSQEAMTSAFLPLIGIALDAQASKCHR